MTHGCLVITSKESKREVLLHTYHTGMDIPKAVKAALEMVAKDHCEFLGVMADMAKDDGGPSYSGESEVIRSLKYNLKQDWLECANGAASVIVAAKPFFLCPMWAENIDDLPGWSGLDSPYRLVIGDGTWTLFDEEKELLFEIDLRDELRAMIVDRMCGKKAE